MNADGTDLVRVPNSDGMQSPVWTPDGAGVTAWSYSQFGWATLRLDGSGYKAIPGTGGYGAASPSWSPDGAVLLLSDANRVDAVSVDGSGIRFSIPDAYGAVYSPDGKHILFEATNLRAGGLWLCDADGSNPHRVAALDVFNDFAWAPDGTHLVVAIKSSDYGAYVVVTDTTGATPTAITPRIAGQFFVHPDWAPAPQSQ